MRKTKYPNYHSRLVFFDLEGVETGEDFIPILALFYREEQKRGHFRKYLITDPSLNLPFQNEEFTFEYFDVETKYTNFNVSQSKKKAKVTQDFKKHLKSLNNKYEKGFNEHFLLFLLSSPNSTFICEDKDGQKLVSKPVVEAFLLSS